jgi:hypothetical protein
MIVEMLSRLFPGDSKLRKQFRKPAMPNGCELSGR